MEIENYLDPAFDPSSQLTKAQLRSILAENGITDLPPPSAKKEVLVALFNEQVRGRAETIRRERQRVRPSAKGITFLDERSRPSPVKELERSVSPKRRSSPSTSPTRKSGGRPTRLLENTKKARSRSRSTRIPLKVKKSKEDAAEEAPKETTRTREEIAPTVAASPLDLIQEQLSRYSDSPRTATLRLHNRLDHIASANRKISFATATPPPAAAPKLSHLARSMAYTLWSLIFPALKAVLVFGLAVFLGLYIRLRYIYPYPYCNSNGPSVVKYDSWMDCLRRYCIPCPPHGNCSDGQLYCAKGYIPVGRGPFYLGSLCRPDLKRLQQIEAIRVAIQRILGGLAAEDICNGSAVGDEPRGMNLKELREVLCKQRPAWCTNQQVFEGLLQAALEETLEGNLKKAIRNGQTLYWSTLPLLGWQCRLQIGLYRHRRKLLGVLALSCLLIYCIFCMRQRRLDALRTDELVHAVLQILAEQDALSRRDPQIPSTISIHQLRDALFLKSSHRERPRLWPKVLQYVFLPITYTFLGFRCVKPWEGIAMSESPS